MQRPQSQTVTLDDILITRKLQERSPRPPNWQAQAEAMQLLAQQMARDSENLMQTLAALALSLCEAGTAGVSLLKTTSDGQEIFLWTVLAGTLADHVGGSTPRNYSPCGVCLEQGCPVLFSHPERYFTYFQEANTPIVEGLVLPLVADRHVFGTIWIMSHDQQRHFDSEDVRLMTSLADFTAIALLLQQSHTRELLTVANKFPTPINAALQAKIAEYKQTQEQSQALIQNLPGGAAFVVDRDLRYVLAEGEALAIAGYKPEDFIGRTVFEVLPPDLSTKYEGYYRQALAGEPFEYEHSSHDRTYVSRETPIRSENGEIYGVLAVSYDITDRKRTEAALKESEEKYRALIASMDEGYAVVEVLADDNGSWKDFLFLEVNPAFVKQTGMEYPVGRKATELLGRPNPKWTEVYGRVAETGEPIRFEESEATPGRVFDLYVFRLGGDGSRRVAVLFTDISDRKRREANAAFLAEMTQDFSRLSTADEIMGAVGAKVGTYLNISNCLFAEINEGQNQAIIEYTWHTSDTPDVTGVYRLSDFITEEFRQAARSGETLIIRDTQTDPRTDSDRYAALKIHAYVTVPFHRQGEWKYLFTVNDSVARNWREDEIELIREVTNRTFPRLDRAYVEQALRESETKYRSLFDSINDGFALLEVLYDDDDRPIDCRFLEVSPSFEAQTGLPQAQSQTFRELIPSIEPGWFEHYHQALVTNALVHFEGWQDYLKTWFEVDVFPYGNPQDRRVTIVFRNINDRKQAEANQIQLIREQAAREQERQRAEALAELDRAKTLFFSNVSHEFRTPLTLSLAPLQDLLSDPTHPLDPVERERLELVHRNNLRLLKLVNTLLDFSRIEAERIEAVYEPTDLAMFTTELTSVFRSAIERAGLQLIVDCPPLPEPVFVDRQMWEKIILNLLSNAFKFTFKGEIRVSLRNNDDNRAILQIQDTGTGIAPEHLPHLFERFYQVRGIQARTHEGSGIGLALVYELVRLHSGTIEVNSTAKEGTCFTISLGFGA